MMSSLRMRFRVITSLLLAIIFAFSGMVHVAAQQEQNRQARQEQETDAPAGFGIENHHANLNAAITAQNVDQLSPAWSFETKDFVTTWPLVDLESDMLFFADWGGAVYALDATTGEMIWRNKVEQPKKQWPWHGFAGEGTLGGGMLFQASVEGNAFALDPETGDVIWETDFAEDPHAGNVGKILYHDGLLYIGLQSVEEPLSAQIENFNLNFRGEVVALDAETGDIVWERPLVFAPHNGVPVWSSFAIDPDTDTLFFNTGNNYTGEASELSDAMLAADAKTGEILWATQITEHDVWAFDKDLRIGPDYDFGAGPQLFEAEIDGEMRQLVGAGQKSGFYHVLDRQTGEIVWQTFVGYGALGGGIHAEASIDEPGGHIYVWSNNRYVYGKPPGQFPLTIKSLDTATGATIWTNDPAAPAAVPSAGYLSNNVYFVGSLDGQVRGFRASDGKQIWSSKKHGAIGSALLVLGDTLFFTTGVPKNFGGATGTNGVFAYTVNQDGQPNLTATAEPREARQDQERQDEQVALADVIGNIDEFAGQDVTVSGRVGEEITRQAFTLTRNGRQILVVGDRQTIPSLRKLRGQVRVSGTVQESLNIRDIEQELGIRLDDRALQEFRGEPFIIANQVQVRQ